MKNKIRFVLGVNEYVFLAIKNKVYKMHFHHIEQIFEEHQNKINYMINLGSEYLISSDIDNTSITRNLVTN